MIVIAGLGNPGEEYANTRHNTGRIVVSSFLKKNDFDLPILSKKHKALISQGKIGKEKVLVIFPETFMNKSGASLSTAVGSIKGAHSLIVVYDDLDLAFGSIKVSYNRGSGGHRGLESIIKSLKTTEFVRIRVGISPSTPSGKIKKPNNVDKFIIGNFSPKETEALKKISKKVSEAIVSIILEGRERAMSEFNS